MATPEGRVKDKVKKLLKANGIWFYMPVQNGMGVHGIPDLVCCYEGLFIGIETKAPGKRPTTYDQRWNKASANQQNRMTEIKNAGGIALVVDDVAQVEELLNAIKPLAELNRNAKTLMGERSWPEIIRRSIGTTIALLSRRKREPCETPPDEKQRAKAE
jgi:hypothetical protein